MIPAGTDQKAIVATSPKNVTVSVAISTPLAVRISIFETPDDPSGKIPTTSPFLTVSARPVGVASLVAVCTPEPRRPGPERIEAVYDSLVTAVPAALLSTTAIVPAETPAAYPWPECPATD